MEIYKEPSPVSCEETLPFRWLFLLLFLEHKNIHVPGSGKKH